MCKTMMIKGMIVKKVVMICVGMFLLAGCSNSAVNPNKAQFTNPSNILGYKVPTDDTAAVTIFRDAGMQGGGCDTVTKVNGEKSLILGNGEKATLYVPEGTANFDASFDCPLGNGNPSPQLSVALTKGVPTYLRIRTDQLPDVKIVETTSDNPAFVCPDPSKKLDAMLDGSKKKFIISMRAFASLFESLRNSARSASVRYKDENLQQCLSKNSAQVQSKMDSAFKKLRDETQNADEKSALIDAYSKFVTVIDASMSINQIDAVQGPFNAAVNKYELY